MNKKTYNKLYLDILEIGNSKVKDGLSYNELKQTLIRKGYDFQNNCIERAVKHWFEESFFHRELHDSETIVETYGEDGNIVESENSLEEHLDCNFVLNGDACLKLIEHKTSKRNIWIARGSLFVAVLAILFQLFITNTKDSSIIINVDGIRPTPPPTKIININLQ